MPNEAKLEDERAIQAMESLVDTLTHHADLLEDINQVNRADDIRGKISTAIEGIETAREELPYAIDWIADTDYDEEDD